MVLDHIRDLLSFRYNSCLTLPSEIEFQALMMSTLAHVCRTYRAVGVRGSSSFLLTMTVSLHGK